MTESEIATSYRQAKNKDDQVKILAELNACSTSVIKQVLVDKGFLFNSTHSDSSSNNRKGNSRIRITNGKDNKTIYLRELSSYERLGWKRGITHNRCDPDENTSDVDSSYSLSKVKSYITSLVKRKSSLLSEIKKIDDILSTINKLTEVSINDIEN